MATITNYVRWADNTDELRKNLAQGLDQIEATRASADKLAKSLAGDNLIRAAHNYAAAVEQIGGASKLTEANQQRVNAVVTKAIEQYQALGKAAPKALLDLAEATAAAQKNTSGWLPILQDVGNSWAARIAEGMLLRDAIREVIGTVKDLAMALPQIALKGASVADVEENFNRLTKAAGLLGAQLMGTLQQGTHNTVDNFSLMKLVNSDLAAGLNLTDKQFGTLAKGAFALAQATGVDVKQALDTMNDALLTGRTRALAALTGKIDLKKAEDDYAKSLGSTADHLSEAGKLEAARVAILKSVSDATERLGEQTDGLDEKVAQVQVTWANFTDDLGKTIATSKVLETGIEGIEKMLVDAFGGSTETLIRAIATAIEDVEIKLVDFAKTAIEAGGAIEKEYDAVKKVFGDVVQVLDGVRLAALYTDRAMITLHADSHPGETTAQAWKRVDDQIQNLLVTMKQRGAALQADDKNQAGVDARTSHYIELLENLRQKMIAAQNSEAAFVGPLQEEAKAHETAGAAADKHAGMLQKSKEELSQEKQEYERWKKAVADATSAAEPFWTILNTIDGSVVEGAKALVEHGAKLEDVRIMYGLTEGQINSIVDQMKIEKTVVDATGQSYAQLTKRLEETANKSRELSNKGFDTNLGVTIAAYKSATDTINKMTLDTFELRRAQIIATADQERVSLDATKEGYQEALDAIQISQDAALTQLTSDWVDHMQQMANETGSFAKLVSGELAKIPSILQHAFEGGGGAQGAVKSIAAGIGGDIGTDAFGRVAAKLSNTFSSAFGTHVTELLGTIIPGIGGVIGSLLGPLINKLFSIGGPSKTELAGRDLEKQFQGQFKTFQDMVDSIGKAYLATGKTLEQAKADVKSLLDAEKQGPAAVQAIIDKLKGALDEAKEIDDAIGGLGIKSHDELQHAADVAREAYEKVAAGVKTGQYTAEDAEKAYRAFQQALADMGDEAAKAWLKAHQAATDATDAVDARMTAAEKDLTDLLDKRKSLADQIAQEAPEEQMGVIEQQQRGQLAALDDQIKQKAEAYKDLADETGQAMKQAIIDALKEIKIDPVHVGVIVDLPDPGPQRDYRPGEAPEAASTGGLMLTTGRLQRFAGGGMVQPFVMPEAFKRPAGPDTEMVWTMPGELIMNEAQEQGIARTLLAADHVARDISTGFVAGPSSNTPVVVNLVANLMLPDHSMIAQATFKGIEAGGTIHGQFSRLIKQMVGPR